MAMLLWIDIKQGPSSSPRALSKLAVRTSSWYWVATAPCRCQRGQTSQVVPFLCCSLFSKDIRTVFVLFCILATCLHTCAGACTTAQLLIWVHWMPTIRNHKQLWAMARPRVDAQLARIAHCRTVHSWVCRIPSLPIPSCWLRQGLAAVQPTGPVLSITGSRPADPSKD